MSGQTRTRRWRRTTGVALFAGALALAGCAQSSGSDPATPDPGTTDQLSESEFTAQFGQVCASIGEELDATPAPDSYEELATQSIAAKQITADGVAELEAITPPASLEEQVTEILGMIEEYSAGFDDLAEAASDEDDARLDELVLEISAAQEAIGAALSAAGGIECGSLTEDAAPADDGN